MRALTRDSLELMVQVNGKLRGKITVAVNSSEEQIKAAALANENVERNITLENIKKIIIVPKKLVNIVL